MLLRTWEEEFFIFKPVSEAVNLETTERKKIFDRHTEKNIKKWKFDIELKGRAPACMLRSGFNAQHHF